MANAGIIRATKQVMWHCITFQMMKYISMSLVQYRRLNKQMAEKGKVFHIETSQDIVDTTPPPKVEFNPPSSSPFP